MTNGSMRLTVSNGTDVAEVYAYTVLHTSATVVVTWTNEQSNVVTDTNTLWYPVSPPFNGIECDWESQTTNLLLTNGVGTWEDAGIPSNARVRFYAAVKGGDADQDHLTNSEEIFVYHTNPDVTDTDGDGLPDGWEVQNGLDPLDADGNNGPEGDPDGDGFHNTLEFELDAPANNPAWNGHELAYRLTHAHTVVVTNTRSITTNLIGMRVTVTNSWDCETGGHPGRQNNTDYLVVSNLLDPGYYIDITVTGSVEDVDAYYDEVTFEAFTNTFYFMSHDGVDDETEEEDCFMVDEGATRNNLILANSTVCLRYDTVGYKWLKNAFAEIVAATNTGILKVEIDKCAADWEPRGGAEDNTTTIRAVVTPDTVKGKFKFTLTDVSSEPGYCLNAPKPAPGSGEDSDAWKDLQFPDQSGFTISGVDRDVAETTATDVSEATVTVKSFDYGAFGRIRAEFVVNGTGLSCMATELGGSQEFTAIPRDENENQISDSWQYELSFGSGASDDVDIPGTGAHEQAGDGLSRYEEYRGFMIKGVHTRTVPIFKDLFLYDEDSLGYGFLPASVVTVHLIDPDEFNGTSLRIVNFNRGHASVVAQHGLWMVDYPLPYPEFGRSPAAAPPGGQTEAIKIDMESFDEVFTNGWPAYLVDETIAHELGHGIDVDEHSPEWGGVSNCVMRYRSPQESANGLSGNWNLVPQRTIYCIPQDDCYGQIDVSDPN